MADCWFVSALSPVNNSCNAILLRGSCLNMIKLHSAALAAIYGANSLSQESTRKSPYSLAFLK